MGMKAQDHTENKKHLQCCYNESQILINSQNPCTAGVLLSLQRGELRLGKQERHFQRGEWHLRPPNLFVVLRSVPPPQSILPEVKKGF